MLFASLGSAAAPPNPVMNDYCVQPPFISQNPAPLVMLVTSKDDKLFYKAYNDLVDLDGDGTIDNTYKDTIDYYGYFNPNVCYDYSSGKFQPSAAASGTNNHYCSGRWSGNFLNWATMARVDVIRKVLYGGKRKSYSTDDVTLTRTVLPADAHGWAKPYKGSDLSSLTPVSWGEGITICNTNSDKSDTSGQMFAIRGFYPFAAASENMECRKTYEGGTTLTYKSAGLSDVTSTTLYARFNVDVQACKYSSGTLTYSDASCVGYGSGSSTVYKPEGILQRYGVNKDNSSQPLMYYGLMTGSYQRHTSGGVLRSNIANVGTQEIDTSNGRVRSGSRIIKNLDNFRVVGYNWDGTDGGTTGWYSLATSNAEGNCNVGSDSYDFTNSTFESQRCLASGNPIGEMYYEAMRYFMGKKKPTTSFFANDGTLGGNLGTTVEQNWCDPYDTNTTTNKGSSLTTTNATSVTCTGYPKCAKPFVIILSDFLPNYDSDQLPGSNWVSTSFTSDASNDTGFNVQSLITNSGINTIEGLDSGLSVSIGQSGTYDAACTTKTASSFSMIRGLCPEEPTKQGSFYIAGLAHYARVNKLNSKGSTSNLTTYVVATESIPTIDIPVGSQTVTMLPTFTDVSDSSKGRLVNMGICPDPSFTVLPGTRTTANAPDYDWFVNKNTNGYQYCYDIMWDDAELGWDYDLDVALRHFIKVSGSTITVRTTAYYAAAGHYDKAGYIINGTTSDGEKYDVKCGGGAGVGGNNACGCEPGVGVDCTIYGSGATQMASYIRSFSAGTTGTTILQSPLWYAAKYGGFATGGTDKPDAANKWDQDGDGTPDTFFWATNPLRLDTQLNAAMRDILGRLASGTAATVLASSEGSGANMLQAVFYPMKLFQNNQATWIGELQNLWYYVDPQLQSSSIRENNNADSEDSTTKILNLDKDYILRYSLEAATNATQVEELDYDPSTDSATSQGFISVDAVKAIWLAGKNLWSATPASRNIYFGDVSGTSWLRYDFSTTNLAKLTPYFNIIPYNATSYPYNDPTATQVIDWIRGTDSSTFRNRTVTILGTTNVWKLGDIVSSTPRIQSGFPLNTYHLPPPDGYSDLTYLSFINTSSYKDRGMVYVGANDGMLHAFKLGKLSYLSGTTEVAKLTAASAGDFGKEAWAYIPKNALPYMKYLLDKNNYCHLYYVDQPTTIVDASIGSGSGPDPTTVKTVSSWKTVLIGGMGLGGACQDRTITCTSTDNCVNIPKTDLGYSSYFALDVSNPTNPTPLWEFTDPDLGYTTTGPAIVRVGDKNKNGRWLAVFASGPEGPIDKSSYHQFLGKTRPSKTMKIYVVDLYTGQQIGTAKDTGIIGFGGSFSNAALDLEHGAFYDSSNYQDDVLYLGYTQCADVTCASTSTWTKGGVLRILTNNSENLSDWSVSTLIKNVGPVTSAVTKLHDRNKGKLWIYFGTGRFFYRTGGTVDDLGDSATSQTLFGIKDMCYNYNASAKKFKFETTCSSSMEIDGAAIQGSSDTADQASLINQTSTIKTVAAGDRGWFINLEKPRTINTTLIDDMPVGAERVVTDPLAIFSGVTFFSTFSPSSDQCSLGGATALWAVRYDTGGVAPLTGKVLMQISTGEIKEVDAGSQFTEKGNRRTVDYKGMPPRGQGLSLLVKPRPLKKILQMKEK
jgi:type IV pilus assembly protein PilY1